MLEDGVVYTYTARNLPSRLRISSTGDISGTPTVAGSFTVTIIATGSDGNVYMHDIIIVVTSIPALVAPIIPNLSEDHPVPSNLRFVVTNPIGGETFTYTATGLPPGITLSTGGLLEGTPSELRDIHRFYNGDRLCRKHLYSRSSYSGC